MRARARVCVYMRQTNNGKQKSFSEESIFNQSSDKFNNLLICLMPTQLIRAIFIKVTYVYL